MCECTYLKQKLHEILPLVLSFYSTRLFLSLPTTLFFFLNAAHNLQIDLNIYIVATIFRLQRDLCGHFVELSTKIQLKNPEEMFFEKG